MTVKTKEKIIKAKETQQYHVIGERLNGMDDMARVSGHIVYADDYSMERMLHGRVFRSVKPSAKIKAIDISAARNHPGVVTVMTYKDVPFNRAATSAVGQTASLGKVSEFPRIVLAEDRVRFYGEPIALIAAETQEAAEEALTLIKIEYEDLPGVFDIEEAMKETAPRVHEDSSTNVHSHFGLHQGDVDEAFKHADVIVENVYQTQYQEHAHMEPESGVAWIDGEGVINLRVATQVIEHYREIAHILGLPESKVRVRGTLMGGGFGGKEDMTVEPYIALLAWHTGRPVKLTYSREEMMYGRHKRVPYKMYYKHGATKDGKLVAVEAKLIGDAGAYIYLSHWILLYTTVHATGPYFVPNVKVDCYSVLTNNIFTSAFRSFGCMQPALGYEAQMDALAKALRMDPAELRLKNYLKTGSKTGTGQVIESAVMLPQTQEAVIKALGPKANTLKPHIKVGQGFASGWYPYGRMCYLHDTSSAWIGMESDGSAVVRSGIPDLGAGQRESLRQITSELTGVPLDKIHVINADSQLTPLGGTVTASRGLLMSGNAARLAAEALRGQMILQAAQMLKTTENDVDLANGEAFSKRDNSNKIPISALVKAIKGQGNPLEVLKCFHAPTAPPVTDVVITGQIFTDFTFGSQAVEVEVDTLTGKVNVTKFAASYDVGRAINPKRVEGQIQGGMTQGLGFAIMEEFVENNGIPENLTLRTYKIPTSKDVPEIKVVIFESGTGFGPFGAKGIGEPPVVAATPAVMSAVEDAVGVRLRKSPVHSDDLFNKIKEQSGK